MAAKFGYNTDLLNPAGSQMSLVQRPAAMIVPVNTITVTPTTLNPGLNQITPRFQPATVPKHISCPEGQTECSGTCTNLQTDLNNCGSCGKACPAVYHAAPVCSGGQCTYTCPAGHGDCNQNTADGCETCVKYDLNNCGTCGNRCPPGNSCSAGNCTGLPVPPGMPELCDDRLPPGESTVPLD